MLVLSRKKNQQVLFPNLGIEVEILRIAGSSVSVGIKAPASVQVLRGELKTTANSVDSSKDSVPNHRDLIHKLRNQLNQAQLTVALAQKQLQMGMPESAEQTLIDMLQRLSDIDQEMTSSAAGVPAKTLDSTAQNSDNRRHALLVEDDPNERALLAGYLRLCGYRTSEAADGVAAMRMLESEPVDLIVLDIRMPRMNGFETVRAIRQRASLNRTPVVIVSGEDRNESIITGDTRGVSEWFAKPLNPDRLVEHLDAIRN